MTFVIAGVSTLGEIRRVIAQLESPVASVPSNDTMVAALEAAARADAELFTFHSTKGQPRLSARALLAEAHRWSVLFRTRGVVHGDRVVLLMPTGPAFVSALLGAMLCGAAAVPLASPMTFGSIDPFLRNLRLVLDSADPRLLVTYPRTLEALHASPPPCALVTQADLDCTHGSLLPLPSISGSDTALVQYTSGTTGRPKGVVISHRALMSNASAIATGLGIGARDVGVSWLPLFHDMGLVGVLLTAIAHPYPVHLASPEWFAMGPERWMDLASRVGASLTAAPNFAYDMCASRVRRLEGARLDSLRVALNGAEPVLMPTLRRFERAMAPLGLRANALLPVYGMAEYTLAVTFPAAEAVASLSVDRDGLERGAVTPGDSAEIVSVGAPVAGTRVSIVSVDGAPQPERRVGTIRVAGASMMDGYFRNEEASQSALRDGWLWTGDLGFIDEGRLFVTGRSKDLIIQSGRNVYPYDLERVAIDVGSLRPGSVVAFGKRNEAKGTEEIVMVAETAEREPSKREALTRTIRGEILATLGVRVEMVHLWPIGSVPRTTSGKPRRAACADLIASKSSD